MNRTISPRDDLRSIREWIRLIRRLRPQVVMVGTPKAGLLGTIAAYGCRVPVRVYLVRGLRAEGLTGRTRAVSLLCEKLTCRLATHIVSVGEDLKTRIAKEGLAARERIDVIGHGASNGVDANRFVPENEDERTAIRKELAIDDKIVIGFVGRLTLGKGIEDALAAVRALNTECDRARLLMVGEYEPENPVPVEVVAELESPQVVRVGRVPTPRRTTGQWTSTCTSRDMRDSRMQYWRRALQGFRSSRQTRPVVRMRCRTERLGMSCPSAMLRDLPSA